MVLRQFLVKWWDKFNSDKVLSQFSEEFSVIPSKSGATIPTQSTPLISQLKTQAPQLPSPSKNKASSSSSSSKAEELKALAKQLLKQPASLSSDEESEHSLLESSTHSHQSSPSQPIKWANYEDSQDTYADFQ